MKILFKKIILLPLIILFSSCQSRYAFDLGKDKVSLPTPLKITYKFDQNADFISINDSKMNEFYNKFLEDLTFNKTETIFRYGLTLEFYYDETDEFENNAPLTIYIANFNRICFLKTTYLGVYNYLSEEKINYEEIVEFLNKK